MNAQKGLLQKFKEEIQNKPLPYYVFEFLPTGNKKLLTIKKCLNFK